MSRAVVVASSCLLAASALACSSVEVEDAGAGGTGAAGTGTGGAQQVCALEGSASIPVNAGGPAPKGGAAAFVVDQILLGNRDTNGTLDPDAWKSFGYDLDCRITSSTSTDVCKPLGGGKPPEDGPGGRDNGFGKTIISSVKEEVDGEALIAAGHWSALVQFDALGSAADQGDVSAQWIDGAELGGAPELDGSDVWPVVEGSARPLLHGYVTGGVWVSGDPITLTVLFTALGYPFVITIHHAVLTAEISPDMTHGSNGQIAGVIDPVELNTEEHRLFEQLNPGYCPGPPEPDDSRRYADILLDGSQDPTATCDGISVGLGFSLRRVQVGAAGMPMALAADPCPP